MAIDTLMKHPASDPRHLEASALPTDGEKRELAERYAFAKSRNTEVVPVGSRSLTTTAIKLSDEAVQTLLEEEFHTLEDPFILDDALNFRKTS